MLYLGTPSGSHGRDLESSHHNSSRGKGRVITKYPRVYSITKEDSPGERLY
jgi:predicted heme/steroid binding protein